MKKHKTYKGKYTPKFPKKYKGNYKNIVYRSLWERKCMVYFDTNPNILSWSSEELVIPYFDSVTKTRRRYYPDFLITVMNSDGEKKTHLIEVKHLNILNHLHLQKVKGVVPYCKRHKHTI